jgi:hypothetical protein
MGTNGSSKRTLKSVPGSIRKVAREGAALAAGFTALREPATGDDVGVSGER